MILKSVYVDLKTIWEVENTPNRYCYLKKDQKRRQEEVGMKPSGKSECFTPEYRCNKQTVIEQTGLMLKWGLKRKKKKKVIYQGKELARKIGQKRDYSIKKDVTKLRVFFPFD